MKKICWIVLVLCMPLGIIAQEEESAELFLEEYTDEFQNLFFEALKQKGIQNYDRAAEKLLECKNLDPGNVVIDYELARTYYLDKKYNLAQGYAILALEKNPDNYWYLEHFVSILEKQGNTIDAFADRISLTNTSLKENLAKIYFQKGKYNEALKQLDNLPSNVQTNSLRQKIDDSLKKKTVKKNVVFENNSSPENPVEELKKRMDALISNMDFKTLENVAGEAKDTYPLQPYFQYAYGLALTKTNRKEEGIEVLETALDFILEDITLKNNVYKALSETYSFIGNQKKAIEYANKIETGS
jgi:predicted Zn-dependent protease